MRQKGFATIFGLCLILVAALIVKGINDAETNHAREVVNFETEQALQHAAESAIVEAADKLPYPYQKIIDEQKTFKRGELSIPITVEAWHERGNIAVNDVGKPGVYIMSRATIDESFFGTEIKIYRRAYAYILSKKQDDGTLKDDTTTIYFMELPTQ